MLFTASLLGTQHKRDSVENKPARLLVFLGKPLTGMPPPLCGRQVMGPSSRGGPSLTEDSQTENGPFTVYVHLAVCFSAR